MIHRLIFKNQMVESHCCEITPETVQTQYSIVNTVVDSPPLELLGGHHQWSDYKPNKTVT